MASIVSLRVKVMIELEHMEEHMGEDVFCMPYSEQYMKYDRISIKKKSNILISSVFNPAPSDSTYFLYNYIGSML